MNLNLNRIKGSFLIALAIICLGKQGLAQSKSQVTYGFSLTGGAGWAIINSAAYQNYMDTVHSSPSTHFNKGFHFWFDYSLGKKTDLQLGIGYQQNGFSRKQENLNFSNYTYPGIGTGRIEDLSNTEKGINYNYRFNYLQIPAIFNFHLSRSSDFKWVNHFSAGITPQFLLKHNLQANCIPGYSIEGQNSFKLDSSGFNAKVFTLSMQIGFDLEYRVNKNKLYFFQPMIGIYPISVTKSPNSALPVFANLTVGLKFSSLKNAD